MFPLLPFRSVGPEPGIIRHASTVSLPRGKDCVPLTKPDLGFMYVFRSMKGNFALGIFFTGFWAKAPNENPINKTKVHAFLMV